MSRLANSFDLDTRKQSSGVTFILNHYMVMLENLVPQFKKETDYRYADPDKKFLVHHVIENTLNDAKKLVNVIGSISEQLDLPVIFKKSISVDVQMLCDSLRNAATAALNRYEIDMAEEIVPVYHPEYFAYLRVRSEAASALPYQPIEEIPIETLKNNEELNEFPIGNFASRAEPLWMHKGAYRNTEATFIQQTDRNIRLAEKTSINPKKFMLDVNEPLIGSFFDSDKERDEQESVDDNNSEVSLGETLEDSFGGDTGVSGAGDNSELPSGGTLGDSNFGEGGGDADFGGEG